MKKIHIITGGTIAPIATHLALSAPAYGTVGSQLFDECVRQMPELEIVIHETRMAGGTRTTFRDGFTQDLMTPIDLRTNNDVLDLVNQLIADPDTKIIFMPVALCDFAVTQNEMFYNEPKGVSPREVGKNARRLKTGDGRKYQLTLESAPKIIPLIRAKRKDIFLVGFKTTDGATEDEQYIAGLGLLKGSSCNLVLANDVKTRVNMIITPEEARYHVTKDRQAALRGLVEMAKLRSHLTFTRSTVVAGKPVPWDSPLVPETLRSVVDHLIAQGAYKPFQGATVGHFACKLPSKCTSCMGSCVDNPGVPDSGPCITCDGSGKAPGDVFLTSQRKTNFNDLAKLGLVKVVTDGPDSVLAYGAKPSVGGQSQRILFGDHPEYDCVVHAHVPLRYEASWDSVPYGADVFHIPIVSQREFECGSHQCGKNTSNGMREFTLPSGHKIMAVFLAEHGPNILFHRSAPWQEICDFIDANFDLSKKTGGYVS